MQIYNYQAEMYSKAKEQLLIDTQTFLEKYKQLFPKVFLMN